MNRLQLNAISLNSILSSITKLFSTNTKHNTKHVSFIIANINLLILPFIQKSIQTLSIYAMYIVTIYTCMDISNKNLTDFTLNGYGKVIHFLV